MFVVHGVHKVILPEAVSDGAGLRWAADQYGVVEGGNCGLGSSILRHRIFR